MKDDNKVDKEALSNNTLVKGQFKADNQYQIVIGPGTVDEVYKQFVNETGVETASKDEAKLPLQKRESITTISKIIRRYFYSNFASTSNSWFTYGD